MTKYINPFTDFGFKKLFGEESSKNILISFLNALLILESPIKEITFKNPFKLGKTKYDRSLIFDIYCENEKGEKFYVEMQKSEQNYFADRMVFYSTFPIQEQAPKGNWNYSVKAIYCIGILEFELKDIKNKDYINTMQIKNKNNEVFYDKYTLITVEIPKFTKEENALKTMLDKWLYFLKNIESFEKLPQLFNEDVFLEASEKTEVANYTKEERMEYERSLKNMWDEYSIMETAKNNSRVEGEEIGIKKGEEIGIKKGREEGQIITLTNNILNMNKNGFSALDIANILEVDLDFVNKVIPHTKY